MNNDCVFCKIVKREVPCYKIWEDNNFLAMLDINPYTIGHVLIIPKKHSKWVWDMNSENYKKLMEKVYYLANILRKVFHTEWIEEVIAGIGIEHTHIHLLPRKRDDGLGEIPIKPLVPKPSEEEMSKIAKKIKGFLD